MRQRTFTHVGVVKGHEVTPESCLPFVVLRGLVRDSEREIGDRIATFFSPVRL